MQTEETGGLLYACIPTYTYGIVWRKDVRFNYEIINRWPMIVSCMRSPNVEKLLAVSDS